MPISRVAALVDNVRSWVAAITSSAGSGDAGKVPITGSSGKLDASLLDLSSKQDSVGLSTSASALGPTQTGGLSYSGKLIPTQDLITATPTWSAIAGANHNYSIGSASDIYLDASGDYSVSFTGFVVSGGNWHGRRFRLWLKAATGGVTFYHNDGSSTAGNRISSPTGGAISFYGVNDVLEFVYDGGSQIWRIVDYPLPLASGVIFGNGLTVYSDLNNYAGVFYLSSYTVATLPSASSKGDRAVVIASDAIWSGGTGCIVRSNGTNWIDPDGSTAVASGAASQLRVVARSATTVGFRVEGASSQTADIFQVYDSSGAPRFAVSYDGRIASLLIPNTQTDSYTFALADWGKNIVLNKATAANLTFPPNSSVAFPLYCMVNWVQWGAGQVTAVPGSGVTLHAPNGLKTRAQKSQCWAWQIAANEWLICGDTTT